MDTILSYQQTMGTIAIALIAGILLGYTLRAARARRERDSLKAQLQELKSRINATVTNGGVAPNAPLRWTGTEIAAVLGAIGTLVGGIYGTYQSRLRSDLSESKSALQRLQAEVAQIFVYDIDTWRELRPATPPAKKGKPILADGGNLTLDCSVAPVLQVGGRPAIAHCGAGRASVVLDGDTRLILAPERTQVRVGSTGR